MPHEASLLEPEVLEGALVQSTCVACTRVNEHVVQGKNASHSFLLLLDKGSSIVRREQVVSFIALLDREVLHTMLLVNLLQQRTVGLVVSRLRAVPAYDFRNWGDGAYWLLCSRSALDECHSCIPARLRTLQSWWDLVVADQMYGVDHCLGEVIHPLGHVV